jgi:hypothetical protein
MSDDVKIDPDGIYSIGTAAHLLGLSASALRDLERRGKLKCSRTPAASGDSPGPSSSEFWRSRSAFLQGSQDQLQRRPRRPPRMPRLDKPGSDR